jgi:hypothetical protein
MFLVTCTPYLSGLTARIFDETKSMPDVYSAFYEFSSLLESKVYSLMFIQTNIESIITYNRRFRYFVMYM